MPLLDWLFRPRGRSADKVAELAGRVSEMERLLERLEKDKPPCPPVVIQHADKVVVERVDYSNHFGTVDIHSLEGQLYIGVNYRGPLRHEAPFPGLMSPLEPPAVPKPSPGPGGGGPACHIRPRRPQPPWTDKSPPK